MNQPHNKTEQLRLQQSLFEATLNDDVVWMEQLLRDGADPNWQPPFTHNSPHSIADFYETAEASCLHIASSQLNREAMRVLLNWGANPDLTDKQGQTPLHYACKAQAETEIRMLLDACANAHLRDSSGQSPRDILDKSELSGGPDVAASLEALVEYDTGRPNVSWTQRQEGLKSRLLNNSSGYSPLDNPRVWREFDKISEVLLEQGTPLTKDDCYAPNQTGETLLQRAVQFRCLDKLLGHLHAQGEHLEVDELVADPSLLDDITRMGQLPHLFTIGQLQKEGVGGMSRLLAEVEPDARWQVRNLHSLRVSLENTVQEKVQTQTR